MSGISATLPGALAALLAVVALILLSERAVRGLRRVRSRYDSTAGGRRLHIRAAVALDPRRRVVLVGCDHHEVLLLTGGSQDLIIGWLPVGGAGGGDAGAQTSLRSSPAGLAT